ncbi:hypothetical protein Tco_0806357 [Tanacetum coccineum]
MNPVAAQLVALDNALVAPEKRLKIGKCNARFEFSKPQRETTYQICHRLPNQDFVEPPFKEEMVPFIKELGYTSKCDMLSEIHTDHMHQPWRTFVTVINRCIFGKSICLDRFRPSRSQILWGMFYQKNVDYVALLWEDFTFQADNREISSARKENMPYPRFTKVIISHFIFKDKTISMRNRKYGALIPGEMINQEIKDSKAYKIYLAYAARAATPKKVRKFKKPASSLKKKTLVIVEEEEPEHAKKDKPSKIPATKRKSSGVPDEPKGKSTGTNEGTGTIPGVPEVPKDQSESENYDDDHKQADDERTESDDEEEETQDDEYVRTPEHYVPTEDEMNSELDDVTEEDYERINEELYGDVNVSLTDAEPADKEKDDKATTVAGYVNVNQEGAGNQVKDDAQATQKTEGPIPSSSISSDYTAKYINFDNISPVDTEVISMLDINVQHEVLCTSPLLTIPVYVIPEYTVVNLSKIVTTASSTTISSLLVTDLEKDVKELKTVDHSAALLSTIKSKVPNAVKEYLGKILDDALYKRDLDSNMYLIKALKTSKKIKIEHAKQQQVPKETITSSDTTALTEFHQKTTLFETTTKSKSFNKSPKQRALYHALMESILEDEDDMDKEVVDKLKKRKQDNADKDEGPYAGSDRGLKRRKTSKDN